MSDTTLWMFPGQGSQRPGMAAELITRHPATAGRALAQAQEATGLPLVELCTRAPAAELTPTDVCQPAILATSIAVHAVLREEGGLVPTAVAGHSLGEYAALVAAESLTASDAMQLVQVRGRLMARVSDRVAGAMSAVIGLPAEQVENLCADSSGLGVVEVANYNDATQTVISGERDAVAAVTRLAEDAGAHRVIALQVSAPFHCSLMREAEAEFAFELARHPFADPARPVFSSVTGTAVQDGAHARHLLGRQLSRPVRWVDVLGTAQAFGIDSYVEVGPGRVLSALANRAAPEAIVRSTNDLKRIAALVGELRPRLPVAS